MKPIKSVQVVRRFTFDEWGGTETVVWNTSKELIRRNNETCIAATKALSEYSEENVEDIKINRFPYIYPYLNLKKENIVKLDKKGGNPYSWDLYNFLIQQKRVDIFHCHTMQRIANSVRLAARRNKIPYIISFHGGYHDVPQSEIDEMMKPLQNTFNYGKFIDIILKNDRFIKDSDGIVCVGENEYTIAQKKYPDKKVIYLPNGVDLSKFNTFTNTNFRKKYNIPENSSLISCISRIDYQKNQLLLIKLLTKIKSYHLLLVGPITSENYYQQIIREIEKNDLQNRVTIIPGLPPSSADLTAAFLTSDYFVLPSRHEPFGIVALEAWAAQVPVIASNVGGLAKLVTHEQTGLLFADNQLDDLAKKIQQLEKDKDFKEKIITNALREVSQNYSWEIITQKLLDFYYSVIDGYRS